ncbi:MAG: hypothetical protein H0T69_07770 [Thermoleophilaceae bacterium]|nr:hypothetical protein [Thermoleophilaceae bacterium]
MSGRPDPAARPLDRLLAGLREFAREFELDPPPYRALVPVGDAVADSWSAVCPHHEATGLSLLIVDNGDEVEPTLRCKYGCPPAGIRRILGPDPERDAQVAAVVEVLVWASTWSARRSPA